MQSRGPIQVHKLITFKYHLFRRPPQEKQCLLRIKSDNVSCVEADTHVDRHQMIENKYNACRYVVSRDIANQSRSIAQLILNGCVVLLVDVFELFMDKLSNILYVRSCQL